MKTSTNKKFRLIGLCTMMSLFLWTIFGCGNNAQNQDSPNKYDSVAVDCEDEENMDVAIQSWEQKEEKGHSIIITRLLDVDNGVLEIAYSPDFGFRFGWFDKYQNMIPLESPVLVVFPVIATQKMIDEGMALKESLGNKLFVMIEPEVLEGGYLFNNNKKIIDMFIHSINEGTVNHLSISRFEESETADPTIGGCYVDYKWKASFAPDDFRNAMKGL